MRLLLLSQKILTETAWRMKIITITNFNKKDDHEREIREYPARRGAG